MVVEGAADGKAGEDLVEDSAAGGQEVLVEAVLGDSGAGGQEEEDLAGSGRSLYSSITEGVNSFWIWIRSAWLDIKSLWDVIASISVVSIFLGNFLGDVVLILLLGIFLFHNYKKENAKKAWGLLLASDAIAFGIVYPRSFVGFLSFILSCLGLFFVYFLIDKYNYWRRLKGFEAIVSKTGSGFGGGFGGYSGVRAGGGFGGGRSGGGGFGGKW